MFVTSALAASTEAAHAAAEHGGAFPPFDSSTFASQLFWLAVSFGLFYSVIKAVIVPRIGGILETRQDHIAKDLDKAREYKEEADAAIASYEQELASAKANANEIAQTARDKAKNEADAERQKVEADLADMMAKAEAKITKVRDAAMAEVGTIAEDTAGSILEELIGTKVAKADLSKAIAAARQ